MKPLKIKAFIRLARLEDIFDTNQNLKLNLPIFQKEIKGAGFYGPYYFYQEDSEPVPGTSELISMYEAIVKVTSNLLYILDFEKMFDEAIAIKLPLVTAEAFDIKQHKKQLRIGLPYYIKNKDSLKGPYFFTNKTKPRTVQYYINTEVLYVLQKHQHIQIINQLQEAV